MLRLRSLALALAPFAVASAQGPAQGGAPFVTVPGVGDLRGLYDHAGRLFFANDDPATGNEPWTCSYPDGPGFLLTDGTPAGTVELITCQGIPRGFTRLGKGAVFSDGARLWRSDGTAAGTVSLVSVQRMQTTDARTARLGNEVFFAGLPQGSSQDWELWKTNGTVPGTKRVADIFPGGAGSFPEAPFARTAPSSRPHSTRAAVPPSRGAAARLLAGTRSARLGAGAGARLARGATRRWATRATEARTPSRAHRRTAVRVPFPPRPATRCDAGRPASTDHASSSAHPAARATRVRGDRCPPNP